MKIPSPSAWKSTFIATLVALYQLNPTASKEFRYDDWTVPANGRPYKDQVARVDDKVVFSWDADEIHNVYIHPSGTCSKTRSKYVGHQPTKTSYVFKESDVGLVTFACNVKQHCAFGQIVKFTVVSTVPSSEPSGRPSMLPSVSVEPSLSLLPSARPSLSSSPTKTPTKAPTNAPTNVPTKAPTNLPTNMPSSIVTTTKDNDGNENMFDEGKKEKSPSSCLFNLNVCHAFAMAMAIVLITI